MIDFIKDNYNKYINKFYNEGLFLMKTPPRVSHIGENIIIKKNIVI